MCASENQAGFRPDRGCIDHILPFRQVSEHRHMFSRPTISLLLGLQAVFDSVIRVIFWRRPQSRVRQRNPIHFLALYSRQQMPTSWLQPELTSGSGVRCGCLFSFFSQDIYEYSPIMWEWVTVIFTQTNRSDLELLDDVVFVIEDPIKLQVLLDHLNRCRYV